MLQLVNSNWYKKDFKRMERRGKDIDKLKRVIHHLIQEDVQTLVTQYHDHGLKGVYQGYRECHVEPNWLLVYRVHGNDLILIRTGTHSDLFE